MKVKDTIYCVTCLSSVWSFLMCREKFVGDRAIAGMENGKPADAREVVHLQLFLCHAFRALRNRQTIPQGGVHDMEPTFAIIELSLLRAGCIISGIARRRTLDPEREARIEDRSTIR